MVRAEIIRSRDRTEKGGRMAQEGHKVSEDLRGDGPQAMLQTMDGEGIDVSIVFRTLGSHIILPVEPEPLGTTRCRC